MSPEVRPAIEQRPAGLFAGEPPWAATAAARLNAAALVPWAFVLLTPVLGFVLLRAPLVNMLGYLDPWLYSGFGWTLSHHVTIFGWPYYVDRFTVVLPIAVSSGLLGSVPAYFVLHYVLMAGCGALLYLAVRRFASAPIAAAGVCLLMLNPFFVRLMAWDYPTFVALPCTIAGAALWYLGSSRWRALWTALGAGICLSAAIYANPAAALVLPALMSVEVIAAVRRGRRELVTLALRVCALAVGALLVLLVGYLGYRAYIGSFPIKDMFQGTIAFIRANSKLVAGYLVPASIWLRTEPSIYAPVLVCIGTVTVLGRSLLGHTLRARMAQFAIAYTLVVWVYRFSVPSELVEWFYYDLTAVTAAFAMPAILDELGRRCDRPRWLVVAGVAIAATGLIDLVIRSNNQSALSVFNYVDRHAVVLACILAACCITAVLVILLKRDASRLVAVAGFCAIVASLALAPVDNYLPGMFAADSTTTELNGYQAGYDMTQLLAKYDRPSSRVLLWDDLQGLGNAGWVNLLGHLGTYTPPPLPALTPTELSMVRAPTTSRVLAVSESVDEIVGAMPALQKQGLSPSLETEGVWGGGHLYYELIKLRAG